MPCSFLRVSSCLRGSRAPQELSLGDSLAHKRRACASARPCQQKANRRYSNARSLFFGERATSRCVFTAKFNSRVVLSAVVGCWNHVTSNSRMSKTFLKDGRCPFVELNVETFDFHDSSSNVVRDCLVVRRRSIRMKFRLCLRQFDIERMLKQAKRNVPLIGDAKELRNNSIRTNSETRPSAKCEVRINEPPFGVNCVLQFRVVPQVNERRTNHRAHRKTH